MRRLEFGWFLPTAGDTTAYGLASAQVAPSLPLFDKVVSAAEAAGFEYMLVPVQTACWEAWISSAMMVARSKSIRMLVAARPSYIHLFWGDTYERIRANMGVIRDMAAKHGRDQGIGFGMRLQVVCRETEK